MGGQRHEGFRHARTPPGRFTGAELHETPEKEASRVAGGTPCARQPMMQKTHWLCGDWKGGGDKTDQAEGNTLRLLGIAFAEQRK